MEPSEIRRHVLHTLDQARRQRAAHREEVERASRAAEHLLPGIAAVWKQAANVLKAEGYPFTINTPAGAVRLASERSGEDFVEIRLETARRPPAIIGRTVLARGRRLVDRETVVAEGDGIEALDDRHALEFLLQELEPFLER